MQAPLKQITKPGNSHTYHSHFSFMFASGLAHHLYPVRLHGAHYLPHCDDDLGIISQRASSLAHIENQSCRNARLLNFLEGMINVLKLARLIHHMRLARRV